MPGIQLYFVVIDHDDHHQLNRYELWCPQLSQPIRLLRSLIHYNLSNHIDQLSSSSIRLFFNGQELQDQYSMASYGLADQCVVQVMISAQQQQQQVSNSQISSSDDQMELDIEEDDPFKNESTVQTLTEDDYYRVGDHVDAFDQSTGAWFPARIVQIKQDLSSEQRTFYYVTFNKPSVGSVRAKPLIFIRPPAYRIVEPNDQQNFQPGSMVLVFIEHDGLWYVAGIEMIKRSTKDRSIRLWLTLITHGNRMPIVRRLVKYRQGRILHLESNVKRDQRTDQLDQVISFGSNVLRFIDPDCNVCQDDLSKFMCEWCGCQKCHLKSDPEKQLVCDECDRSTHLWCLRQPLESIPKDPQWYCDECRNESREDIVNKQNNFLNVHHPNSAGSWGFGMACVARSLKSDSSQSTVFGSIPGVPVGTLWRFRVQASEAGVHAPLVAGIHGRENQGAYSLVYSAANSDDVDLGDQLYYTANGGYYSKSHKKIQQKDDLSMKGQILALARNCSAQLNHIHGTSAGEGWRSGKPVRLLRNGNGRFTSKTRNKYLPKIGVRYDGLYKVVKYWPDTGHNGNKVWRFLLRRDDPEPAPWTDAGRYRARKLGLQMIYPPGWCQLLGQKRQHKLDQQILTKQIQNEVSKKKRINQSEEKKSETYQIPDHINKLISTDEKNKRTWSIVLERNNRLSTKKQFVECLNNYFRCSLCMDGWNDLQNKKNPLITTDCGHHYCLSCLEQALLIQQQCPVCRESIIRRNDHQIFEPNIILKQIFSTLLQ